MSETRMILGKITALRQRLEQARGLAREAGSAAALLDGGDGQAGQPPGLERQAALGAEHDARLDEAVRPLLPGAGAPAPVPRQLTARARRVLERGRELLGRLRPLADALAPGDAPAAPLEPADPLAVLCRQTVAMTDTALRTVPLLPDTATAQLQLCAGLEAILDVVEARLATLAHGASRRQQEASRVE